MARVQRPRAARPEGRGIAPPPQGLVVERVMVDDEEMLLFSWGSAPTPPPPELSEAETDVLARVVLGQSNADIAKARKTAVRTVANQVASLLRKTGAASRFELIRRYGGTGARRG